MRDQQFVFLTEAVYEKNDSDKGIVVLGYVYGEVRVGDTVYLYHPGIPICTAVIDEIEVQPNQFEKTGKNQNLALHFHNVKKNVIPQYAVISNVEPNKQESDMTKIQNPLLLGLTFGYQKFYGDINFINLLTYSIVHGIYTMAYHENAEETDGKFYFTVTKKDGNNAIPVFTDYECYLRWNDLKDNEEKVINTLHDFPYVANLCLNGTSNGLVINPFGPVPVYMSNELITDVMNTETYKKQFNSEGVLNKKSSDDEVMIRIKSLEPGTQTDLLVDAVRTYSIKHDNVNEVYLFIKKQDNKENLLCVVDVPKGSESEAFSGIHQYVAPYLTATQYIEYTTKAPSFDGVENRFKPVYKK